MFPVGNQLRQQNNTQQSQATPTQDEQQKQQQQIQINPPYAYPHPQFPLNTGQTQSGKQISETDYQGLIQQQQMMQGYMQGQYGQGQGQGAGYTQGSAQGMYQAGNQQFQQQYQYQQQFQQQQYQQLNQILEEAERLLKQLNGSKASIKSTAMWFIQIPQFVDQLTNLILQVTQNTSELDKQIYLIYLLNDILLKSLTQRQQQENWQGDLYAYTISGILVELFQTAFQNGTKNQVADTKERLVKILDFWLQRKVFDQRTIDQVKHLMENPQTKSAGIQQQTQQQQYQQHQQHQQHQFNQYTMGSQMVQTTQQQMPFSQVQSPNGQQQQQGQGQGQGQQQQGFNHKQIQQQQSNNSDGGQFRQQQQYMHQPRNPMMVTPQNQQQYNMQQQMQMMQGQGQGQGQSQRMNMHNMHNMSPQQFGQNQFPAHQMAGNQQAIPMYSMVNTQMQNQLQQNPNTPRVQQLQLQQLQQQIQKQQQRPREEISFFSFPPGIIPKLVRRMMDDGNPPYTPLDPEDIRREGIPKIPKIDAYLQSRLDKFYAELQDYRPGMEQRDKRPGDRPSRSRQRRWEDAEGEEPSSPVKGPVDPETRMRADGSYAEQSKEGQETSQQRGEKGQGLYAGLGSKPKQQEKQEEEDEEDDDEFAKFRKLRSGYYHQSMAAAQRAARKAGQP